MKTGSKVAIAFGVLALVVIVAIFGYNMGWYGDKEVQSDKTGTEDKTTGTEDKTGTGDKIFVKPDTDTAKDETPAPTVTGAGLPVEQLNAGAKDKFTMATVSTGNLSFYSPGADVSDPYVTALDSIDLNSGSTTDYIIQTNTNYDLYYTYIAATYYDDKIQNWKINYNPDTGKGFLLIGSAGTSYHGVSAVGAFVSYAAASLPEVQSGMNDTGTGTVYYAETLGGSGWFQADIGNDNANSELREAVICFRDNDGDMEGTEVTALTASYVSGSTAISIPGDLKKYWQDAMGGGGAQCVDIAALLGSSVKARWQFAMTVDETTFDTTEEFEITFDDLGDYLQKQYPSRSAKASASSVTIGDQA